jgi:hypothetical protein
MVEPFDLQRIACSLRTTTTTCLPNTHPERTIETSTTLLRSPHVIISTLNLGSYFLKARQDPTSTVNCFWGLREDYPQGEKDKSLLVSDMRDNVHISRSPGLWLF